MKQYCRYCTHLHVNNFPYCDVKEKELKETTCKTSNNCKDFLFADCEPEYQDAFGETKGYYPKNKHHKNQCKGQCKGQLVLQLKEQK
ncbi:MAG: hypothetical protein KBT27_13105 [Prevotellaceae bacterium]|nr:hypothetical protein [Candidatus Faecinaster equi]